MRVLQLHTRYREAGGEDRVVAAEAGLLRSAGHKVEQLVAVNPEGAIPTAAALVRSPWNARSRDEVERLLSRFKPDVAHVHNTWFALSPSVIEGLRSHGVPTVMTIHNYRLMCLNGMLLRDGKACEDCVGRSPLPGLRHRCYRKSAIASTAAAATMAYNRYRKTWAQGVTLFLTPTQFVGRRMLDAGFPGDRLRLAPHFVEDPGSRPAPPSRSRTVLHVGRLSPDKGTPVLLDAWTSLGASELELVCIGDGPLRNELARRRLPGVRFIGSQPPSEVRKWMLRARVLVASSIWYETFGLVVAEALAAGLPVIVPSRGALAEVAAGAGIAPEGGCGGSLVAELSGSMRRAGDDSVVDAAGASARARFLAHYTPAEALARLVDAYQWAIGSAAGARTVPPAGGK